MAPVHGELRLPHATAELTVLIADAGGRELGGLPITLVAVDGAPVTQGAAGRVGQALTVPAGKLRLQLEITPPFSQEIELAPSEARTLDLGRLASVLVRLSRSDGRITHGAPLTLSPSGGGPTIEGHVGEELLVWPGSYLLTVRDAGELAAPPPRTIEAGAGALNEVELGVSRENQSARLLGQGLVSSIGAVARRVAARFGGEQTGARQSTRARRDVVMLTDAHGRPMRRAVVLEGDSVLHLWTGDALEVPEGTWRARLVGFPGEQTVRVDGHRGLDLGALGAVEVHLKAPDGASLRFAPMILASPGGGQWPGRVGIPLELPPGRYALSLPTLPGFEREVVVEGCEVTRVDLGVAGGLTLEASAEHPRARPPESGERTRP